MNVYFALRIYAMVFILRNILAQLLLFNVRFHFCGFIGPQYSINVCGFMVGSIKCMFACLLLYSVRHQLLFGALRAHNVLSVRNKAFPNHRRLYQPINQAM